MNNSNTKVAVSNCKKHFTPATATFASLSAYTTSISDVIENGRNDEVLCCNRSWKALELSGLRK